MLRPLLALLALSLAAGPAAAQAPAVAVEAEAGVDVGDDLVQLRVPEADLDQVSVQPPIACRLATLHVGDPTVPMAGWVDPDPDGCFRHAFYRLVGWPPPAQDLVEVHNQVTLTVTWTP